VNGVFVAGTDTEAGKTVLAAVLVAALRAQGVDAAYRKPVSTDGVEEAGRLVSPDALWVRRVCGLKEPPHLMNPFCLGHALSPLAAARLEGVELSWEEVVFHVRGSLAGGEFYVCEGVGGLLAPLVPRATGLDLMAELRLPVVLAARPGLGTINHTLLSLLALRRKGLRVLGFTFSGPEEDPEGRGRAKASNSRLIAEFSSVPFLGALPRLESFGAAELAAAAQGLELWPLWERARPGAG
jgi:dethiobiotin synthetase